MRNIATLIHRLNSNRETRTMKYQPTLLTIGSLAAALSSQAALLVHEPFDYAASGDPAPGPSGTLLYNQVAGPGTGGSGGLGMTGEWQAFNQGATANSVTVYPQGSTTGIISNTGALPNAFDGTVANLATSGGFFGVTNATNTPAVGTFTNGTDHIEVWRPIAPSVTATFGTGNTTWFSLVTTRGYSNNARSPSFYLGAGALLEDRGVNASAPGIGAGGGNSDGGAIFPQYWNTGMISNNGTNNPTAGFVPGGWVGSTGGPGGFGAPNVTVGRIQWNADTNGGDIISVFNFLQTDTLSEAAFNAGIASDPLLSSAGWPAQSPLLDETTFNMISIGGGRFFADEIRIGTTFADVTPIPEPSAALLSLLALGGCLLRRRRC